MKLFIWTGVLTEDGSDSVVVAIGNNLSNVFRSWEKAANDSKRGYEKVRNLVILDEKVLKKGRRRYRVNRKFWRQHPHLRIYDLSESTEPATYWAKDIGLP